METCKSKLIFSDENHKLKEAKHYLSWRDRVNPTFNELFIREMTINPLRYVWHVSYKNCRKSIFKKGIIKQSGDYAVFANNQHAYKNAIETFWPIPIDSYDEVIADENVPWDQFVENIYDFWRIDTHSFKAEWRVDPLMRIDYYVNNLRSPFHYICTKQDIPVNAITLYNYNIDKVEVFENVTGTVSVINHQGLYLVK